MIGLMTQRSLCCHSGLESFMAYQKSKRDTLSVLISNIYIHIYIYILIHKGNSINKRNALEKSKKVLIFFHKCIVWNWFMVKIILISQRYYFLGYSKCWWTKQSTLFLVYIYIYIYIYIYCIYMRNFPKILQVMLIMQIKYCDWYINHINIKMVSYWIKEIVYCFSKTPPRNQNVVWSTRLIKDRKFIKEVQKRAAKLILELMNMPYKETMKDQVALSLRIWRYHWSL